MNNDKYWDKTGTVDPDYFEWDYEDQETGDAFRLINNGIK